MPLTVLYGENDFEKRQKLAELVSGLSAERYDGEEVSLGDLSDLLGGQTLFSGERSVVIYGLSENTESWQALPDMAQHATSGIVLVEPKLDKRTKTYKWLVKNAQMSEFTPLTDRQRPAMVDWAAGRAKHHGYSLDRTLAGELVDRLGYDQLRVDMVLEQLSLVDVVTLQVIDAVVPLAKSESVFELFESALKGRVADVQRIIAYLEQTSGTEGAYMTLGLLASQLVNLNGLVLSDGDSGRVATDLGAHPFVLKKLAPLARNISHEQLGQINSAFARADDQMKSTGVNPWLLVEVALVVTARLLNK